MKLSDKILQLRKAHGWSQEDLAEKLGVSRQAVSRWESAAAQPDAANILHLSKLFGVTTDYLLHDEYESDNDLPKVRETTSNGLQQIMVLMIMLEVMILIVQFMSTIVLQNEVLGVLSFLPFVGAVGGFEYAYRKRLNAANETVRAFRKRFYKISAWLGTYFPIRLVMTMLIRLYPRPYNSIVFEGVMLLVYLLAVILITRQIENQDSQ